MHKILTLIAPLLFVSHVMPIISQKRPNASFTPARALQMGDRDVKRFYSGQIQKLWEKMSPEMKQGLKSADALQEMSRQIHDQFGSEASVLHEDALPSPSGVMIYSRIVEFSKYRAPMVVTIAYGTQKRNSAQIMIEGFHIKLEANPAASRFEKYKNKTCLQFPLQGEWTIYQGGDMVAENYHAATPDERYAYDIVRLRQWKLFSGNGGANDDWFSFGQPVYADGPGKILRASDDNPDNLPMKANPTVAKYGNTVVIDHGNGEFSMYAHLKHGSIRVKVGQIVKAGQSIGQIGNSGDSPFPHLHYHLQDSGVWFDGLGLPIRFHRLIINGKIMKAARPVRGDQVDNNGYSSC